MNNYYLISLSEEPKIIKIDYVNDISHGSMDKIDSLTQKYSLNELKQTLFNAGKIDSMDSDIVIMHQSKFNGKDYIKYFPILTNNESEYNLESVNVVNNKVQVKEVEHLIKIFFNKSRNKDMREMIELYYSDMDEYLLKRMRIIYSGLFDDKKKEQTKNSYVSYPEVRKLSSMIYYFERFKDDKSYLEYINKVDSYIRNHNEKLLEMTDSKVITGQMSFDFKNQKEETEKYKNPIVEERMQLMNEYDEIEKLKQQPWDNPLVEQYFKTGRFPENFNFDDLSLEDLFRIGRIDAVDYRYRKMDEEEKRK